MRSRFIAIDRENYFLDERAQQLLLIARRRRRCIPDRGEIGAEVEKAIALVLAENARSLFQSAGEFLVRRRQISQALLPLALQPTRDQPVVRINGAIAPLRPLGFVGCPLDSLPPLLERCLGVGFEPFGGGNSGGQLGGLDRGQEGVGKRRVDLHAADIETVTAPTLDNDLAGAVIARGGVASAIVGLQAPTAMPTAGQALQQR